MKSTIHSRKRVFLFAATILAVCAGLFIVSTQLALGAQGKDAVSQQSMYSAAGSPVVTGEAVINDDPGPEYITGAEAVDAYTRTATEIFGFSVDKSTLSVNFENNPTIEGINHYTWTITTPEYGCGVDAVTGTVIYFELYSGTYPGDSITQNEFDTGLRGSIRDYSDNIYITATRDLVTGKLAQGRNIDSIEIDGIGFVYDDENAGQNPDATGSVSVDCHVYMETGMCYILTYWGIDEVSVCRFSSHPTKQACQCGFYYEDQADENPPYGYKGQLPDVKTDSITEEDAKKAFIWMANNIFEISVDESKYTATFEEVRTDENASIYSSVHGTWHIQNSDLEWDSDCYCLIDAVTGNVLIFDDQTPTYPGKSITEGDFTSEYAHNIYDDPDNIYTTAARDFVESKLSDGRKITDIKLDGIQFIWDDPDCLNPDDADTPGTVQVDCWVIMESGQNYNLSFWGTDQVVLKFFSTYPTMYACQWGYFYEKNAPNSSKDWTTAPGITEGTNSDQDGK